MELTPEQKAVIEQVVNNPVVPDKYGNITLVPAGAGCGKTFISTEIVSQINPVKGLYTAFNKAIVSEGAEKFYNYNMECRTFHSLAYKHVRPGKDIRELSYNDIVEEISYKQKAEVIDVIGLFYLSASEDMSEFFLANCKSEKVYDLAIKYVNKMVNREIPMSFSCTLKYFHLMLVEGMECKYDIVILDEINDVTAVALEIFKLLQCPIKLGLGESNQAIYKFLNLVDGFEQLSTAVQLPLTNSFRCSTDIASGIQLMMRRYVNDKFTFTGTESPCKNGHTLYVSMTNAAIIRTIKTFLTLNKGFKLLRKLSDIFALPMAMITASKGNEVYQHKYKYLEKEYKKYANSYAHRMTFFSYLNQEVGDQEITSAIALLGELATDKTNIFNLYREAKEAKKDPNVIISTVFTAKGLEMETVHINDDMNRAMLLVVGDPKSTEEDYLVIMRCYYVACSRAGVNLHNAKYLTGTKK